MASVSENAKPLSPWWRHTAILVMIAGFSILSIVTMLSYKYAPPIPEKVVDGSGATIMTGRDIEHGQAVFLKYGLMEHGTLWGHGAYLGPDYSAEYLHRLALIDQQTIARDNFSRPFDQLAAGEADAVKAETATSLQKNRYDAATKTLVFTPGEVAAYQTQAKEWAAYFTQKDHAPGLPADYIKNPKDLQDLSSYFAWAAWATVARRPGKDYSYTNNWPYEPLVGNHPPTEAYLWSALSLVALLAGLGLVLFIFGKFNYLGWKGDGTTDELAGAAKQSWSLTPSQWATGKYFAVVALLFLLQTLVGGALAHYRVEPFAFYGINIAKYLPWTLLRTWHLQLAIFWIATAWV
ncbi:MAG: nitric-oxide reductase large subunit, partial [Acidobacteriota bacterium]